MRSPKVALRRFTRQLLCLLAVVCGLLSASCSEWDTDSLGEHFAPANSQVRQFTHLIYVEYTGQNVRVWGPALSEVQADVQGHHVTLDNHSDSLAVFAYGYPATTDSMARTDASLTIASTMPYALYLSGLSIRAQHGATITGQGPATCHLVLPSGSKSHLFGPLSFEGPLTLSGRGSLEVESAATCLTAASLHCQYGISLSLCSTEGDGIRLDGPMRAVLGTWNIHAQGHGVSTPDSITVLAGTWQGTSATGAFLHAPGRVMLRRPTLLAAAAQRTEALDTAYVALRYDSVQCLWQQRIDTVQYQADSLYQVFRNADKNPAASYRPRLDCPGPWLMFSNPSVQLSDTLHVLQKKSQSKK